jgi:hypothetical protein
MLVDDFRTEYERYRFLGERAMAQMSDAALNALPAPDANSAAMIARHVGSNLASRFTDFLTTDGEKPWRDRDGEFETREYGRGDVERVWRDGWTVLSEQLARLTDDDLPRTVTIRHQPLTVHAALSRSLSHMASHVGQLVLLGRIHAGSDWQTLSIPRGKSAAVNQAAAARAAKKFPAKI